ncbi:PREDICTED: uncharacterized protein LOC107194936 [Dufourea novaeangliae]|uniref:Uncharacterized protein n=1 Tax=Dufourea novaeangliae TaxID=178035 RepID=A0A154P2S6_DUFNO|nr:PREDICTED: uncharacterized protein LOC107194936 [Dufourea novaeangliae]KZC06226.1 hypothetical protein WN55_10135 [Dufourea novaeangliae]
MKSSIIYAATWLLCVALDMSEAIESKDDGAQKTPRAQNKIFNHRPNGGLISFNSEQEKLRLDWAVTIPFISIPIDYKIGEHGEVPPLLDVNTKTLGIVGVLTTLASVFPPLFSKSHHHMNYRSGDNTQWFEMGNTINDMIFGNNYVAPCIQRIVCSIVSMATHSESPTNTEKIIDGLSSYKWFKDVTNGTIIQDAVNAGRKGNHDCERIYKDCLITPKLFKAMMSEFGIV